MERALVETGADAAWVGWGFVAEDAAFAELCDRLELTFIGPRAQAMRAHRQLDAPALLGLASQHERSAGKRKANIWINRAYKRREMLKPQVITGRRVRS